MRVFSVIVAFQPDIKMLCAKVEILKQANIEPLIVNNSDYALPAVLGCNILELGDNLGIATAQNRGVQQVRAMGADVIMFFDQDSVISTNLVNCLLQPIFAGNAQMTAPVFYDEKKGFFYQLISISANGKTVKHRFEQITDEFCSNVVISSGHTVLTEVFEQVGYFADAFFIDYVDTEWCLRAAAAGFVTNICKRAVMQHSIGDKVIDLKWFKVPVHNPYRRYYRVRNAFLLFGKPHIPVRVALRETVFAISHHLILICCCPEKRDYIKYLCLGIFDGICRRSGKLVLKND